MNPELSSKLPETIRSLDRVYLTAIWIETLLYGMFLHLQPI